MAGNVVYRDRVVWSQNYGFKDKKKPGEGPDQDTVFRVASISKIFTVSRLFYIAYRWISFFSSIFTNQQCSSVPFN